ncbi:MAG: NAD(P)H-binding protein [Rhodobacteraceae bacterium]|nr:NAD(P)H-binding protein [Paracoccaceae bacterium]
MMSLLSPVAYRVMAMSTPEERIIVSGASGQLGRLVVEELLGRGVSAQQLILVSRSPDRLAEYAGKGASTPFGDVDEPESLLQAYAGGTRMLMISLALGSESDKRAQRHKAAFDAAAQAGVRHIVYTSFVGADKGGDPVTEAHRQSEAFLQASGAKWTILRNSLYADVRLPQALHMARTGSAVAWPGDPKSALVTRRDFAAAAAGALAGGNRFENKTFTVTGPALVNTADIAAIVGEITGQEIEVVERDPRGPNQGPPGPEGPGGPPPDSGIAEAAAVVTDAVVRLSGREAASMREFLLAHGDELRASAAAAATASTAPPQLAPAPVTPVTK